MKALLNIALGAAALLAIFFAPDAQATVAPGQPAPDFTVTDVAGKSHKLSDYRGKIVILEWLNPACPYVLRHYRSGNMPSTQAAAAAEGAIWLQVNSTAMGDLDPAATADWQKKQNVVATGYVRDQSGKLGRLFAAETTPHLYVIARDGTLAYQGAIDDQPNAIQANTMDAHNYVKAALTALKAGKPVETATTKPYGCGVKYDSAN
jgi:hypothetical protein